MAGRSPADVTTIRPRAAEIRGPGARAAPYLTVLWHPTAARIGDVTPLADGAARLSRLEPELGPPQGGSRSPLGDPHLSRSPALITRDVDGGVTIEAPSVVELVVDGEPVVDGRTIVLTSSALARGVVLELAGRVALLLHDRLAPSADPAVDGLIGSSDAIAALRGEIARVGDLDVPVLIGGETGSGKEHVARAIHQRSPRARGPFVAVNMATLATGTAAAQLFGHARGAFTGADRARLGLFQEADGGTLFLDEVGDTPADVQAMLLRALETGEVRPIGAEGVAKVEVRIVAASDAELDGDPRFRPQLLHRLAGYRIEVPPLRERKDDLGRLLVAFVARELTAAGAIDRLAPPAPGAAMWLPVAAIRAYVQHAWPGNVRELANLARHLAIVGRSRPLSLAEACGSLGEPVLPAVAPPAAAARAAAISDDHLIATLAARSWKIAATAQALGISKTTLYALMDRCPRIRKARDLSRDEIAACRDATAGDLDRMSAQLQVSRRGLQLRMRELGM